MKRLLFLILIASCTRGSSGSLTFGAAGPWKEGYGAMNRRGIELAVSQINARPERAGNPLQIRYEDDEGSGEAASRPSYTCAAATIAPELTWPMTAAISGVSTKRWAMRLAFSPLPSSSS